MIKQNYDGGTERRQRRRKERERQGEREENYLNLTTFHQRAVQLFSGFLCVCAGLKCHKAKTLRYAAEVRAASEGHVTRERKGREENLRICCTMTLFHR